MIPLSTLAAHVRELLKAPETRVDFTNNAAVSRARELVLH